MVSVVADMVADPPFIRQENKTVPVVIESDFWTLLAVYNVSSCFLFIRLIMVVPRHQYIQSVLCLTLALVTLKLLMW